MLETLKQIVAETPGARGAVLMGFDGIVVEQHLAEGEDIDIESVAMEFSFRFIELRDAAESLEMGGVTDITIRAEHGTLLARILTPEYFVAMLLGEPGHFGKGRWKLRSSARTLSTDL